MTDDSHEGQQLVLATYMLWKSKFIFNKKKVGSKSVVKHPIISKEKYGWESKNEKFYLDGIIYMFWMLTRLFMELDGSYS